MLLAPFGDLNYKQKQDVESFFIFLFYCKHKNSSVQHCAKIPGYGTWHPLLERKQNQTFPKTAHHPSLYCLLSKESKALHRNFNEAALGVTLSCNPCSPFTEGWGEAKAVTCQQLPMPRPANLTIQLWPTVLTLRSQFLFKSQVTKGKQKSSCQYFFAMATLLWFLSQTPKDQGRSCCNTAEVTDI